MSVNGDALLEQIQPKLRTGRTQICLDSALLDEYHEAAAELSQAQSTSATRLNGKQATAPKKLAARVDELLARVEQASTWFEFKAMPIAEYQALCAEHPPRAGNQMDLFYGHDRDAVINALVRKCMTSPTFSDEGWERFLQTCIPSEWAELRDTVTEVNGGSVKPPKSLQESPRVPEPVSDSE